MSTEKSRFRLLFHLFQYMYIFKNINLEYRPQGIIMSSTLQNSLRNVAECKDSFILKS